MARVFDDPAMKLDGRVPREMRGQATAVPQLLYLETIAAKWLFSQEKATSHDTCKGMRIVEPL